MKIPSQGNWLLSFLKCMNAHRSLNKANHEKTKSPDFSGLICLFGGVAGNRTPVRRRPYSSAYSLGTVRSNPKARTVPSP